MNTSEVSKTNGKNNRLNSNLPHQWKYSQEWHNVIMLHFNVPVDIIWSLLPLDLKPDLFDGKAWVSWLGFEVKNNRLGILPGHNMLPDGTEICVRTYVVKDGLPGVYVLQAYTDTKIRALLASFLTGLAYGKMTISEQENTFFWYGDHLKKGGINFLPQQPIADTDGFYSWVTKQRALFFDNKGKLYKRRLYNTKWQLHDVIVSVSRMGQKLGDKKLTGFPLVYKHFCQRVTIYAEAKEREH